MKKIFSILFVLLIVSLLFVSFGNLVSAKRTDNQWQTSTNGGSVLVSKNGTILLSTPTNLGSQASAAYYKPYAPTGSFVVTLKINSIQMAHCGIVVDVTPPYDYGSTFDQVVFEFHYSSATEGMFDIARWAGGGWTWQNFVTGQTNTWYIMQLTVNKEPFTIKGDVYNAKGHLLGTMTISDMTSLSFSDIHYIDVVAWDVGAKYQIKGVSITPIS